MNKKHLFKVAAMISIAAMMTISCSKSSSSGGTTSNPPPTSTGNAVSMYNMSYSPSSITVAKGTAVVWTNNDGYPHTVTSNDGTSFNSGSIAGGATFTYTTVTAGTFNYHCTIHGTAMSGTLIVTP